MRTLSIALGLVVWLAVAGGCDKGSGNGKSKPTPIGDTKPSDARPADTKSADAMVARARNNECYTTDDCVVSCTRPNDCCGECACTTPYSHDELARVQKDNEVHCREHDGCPKMDCKEPPGVVVPVCDQRQCTAVIVPPLTPRKSDDECVLSCYARGDCCSQLCSPCGYAYHKQDFEWLEANRRTRCEGRDNMCGEARCARPSFKTVPVCGSNGYCEAKQVPL